MKGKTTRATDDQRNKALAVELMKMLPRANLLEPIGVRVGAFQCLFLIAVILLGEEAYCARIFTWMKDKLGKEVNLGQVYNAALRLSDQQLVSDRETPPPSGIGRSVIVYSVTPLGLVALNSTLAYLTAKRNLSS